MANSFKTELPTMQAASQHVYEVNSQIQTQLASLLARLEPLMSTWQGGAATSFQALKIQWHDNATTLNAVLREIGDGLVRTHANYHSTETTNTEGFTRMTSGLA
jgi:WXG100 family type VII secretion target